MAEKIFISQQAYAKYETGQTTPNPETLSLIIKELGISADDLLETDNTVRPFEQSEIDSIFQGLTEENQQKLLELAKMYADSQKK